MQVRAYIHLNCATIESEVLDDVEAAYRCYKAFGNTISMKDLSREMVRTKSLAA